MKSVTYPFYLFFLIISAFLAAPASVFATSDCARKLAVVVDPFSSGDELPTRFIERGYDVIAVHAHGPETREPIFFKSYVESGMRRLLVGDIEFDGNYEALANYLLARGASIVTAGSESGVIVANKLAAQMQLRGNEASYAINWIDKYEMHMRLKEAGLPYIDQIKTDRIEEALRWREAHGKWPVVIKPPSSAGTNGVIFVRDEEHLRRAFESLIGKKNGMGLLNEKVLIQEFVEGEEYAVDTVGIDGRHIVTEFLYYERSLIPGAATLYRSNHMIPFEGEIQKKLYAYALDVLKVLKIENGPAHMEVKIRPDGQPVLVEVGARICGAYSPTFVRASTGYCQVQATVDAYSDPETFFLRPIAYDFKRHAQDFFVATQTPGYLFDSTMLEAIQKLPGVLAVYPSFKDGEVLPASIDADSLVLHVQMAHEDLQTMIDTRRQIEAWEAEGRFERAP